MGVTGRKVGKVRRGGEVRGDEEGEGSGRVENRGGGNIEEVGEEGGEGSL